MNHLHQLIYICSATRPLSEDDLIELLADAKGRNVERHITGILLYYQATFLQVLEGEAHELHHLYNAISNDPRVTGMVMLTDQVIGKRDFPDWSMAFKKVDDHEAENLEGFLDLLNGDELPIKERSSMAAKLIGNFVKKLG
ncbi:BLUF domain-containing protein [Oceanospirillum beijerinckii]|uniref:BLUF domain-containing protein n=1 Tax=Oceanospirillum beijerinckii TaxID=64976 RepID=UPI00041B1F6E|nr:BLUF domain-containing protein [Oceanospirillum beijerinckii]